MADVRPCGCLIRWRGSVDGEIHELSCMRAAVGEGRVQPSQLSALRDRLQSADAPAADFLGKPWLRLCRAETSCAMRPWQIRSRFLTCNLLPLAQVGGALDSLD
jgi:hypothetical protein